MPKISNKIVVVIALLLLATAVIVAYGYVKNNLIEAQKQKELQVIQAQFDKDKALIDYKEQLEQEKIQTKAAEVEHCQQVARDNSAPVYASLSQSFGGCDIVGDGQKFLTCINRYCDQFGPSLLEVNHCLDMVNNSFTEENAALKADIKECQK